jgi:hypothetical protein
MYKTLKLSFIFLIFIGLLNSCDSLLYHNPKNYEKVYTGMGVEEFMKKHPAAKNEFLNESITIYSILYYDPMGSGPYKKYYYFENNRLIRVDKGERAVDYRIRID